MHIFDALPEGIDVLLTHGPARGVLDYDNTRKCNGSVPLYEQIMQKRPKCHLHGHIHEQRGYWTAGTGSTIEFEYPTPKGIKPFPTKQAPLGYPAKLVVNNAMASHPLDHKPRRLAGSPRLIKAERGDFGWRFTVIS